VTAVDAALKQELEMDGRQLYLDRAGDSGGGRPKFQRTCLHHVANALHFFVLIFCCGVPAGQIFGRYFTILFCIQP